MSPLSSYSSPLSSPSSTLSFHSKQILLVQALHCICSIPPSSMNSEDVISHFQPKERVLTFPLIPPFLSKKCQLPGVSLTSTPSQRVLSANLPLFLLLLTFLHHHTQPASANTCALRCKFPSADGNGMLTRHKLIALLCL